MKYKCDFLNSQWQNMAIFYHRTMLLLNKIPQDVVLCEKVEHFHLKL